MSDFPTIVQGFIILNFHLVRYDACSMLFAISRITRITCMVQVDIAREICTVLEQQLLTGCDT